MGTQPCTFICVFPVAAFELRQQRLSSYSREQMAHKDCLLSDPDPGKKKVCQSPIWSVWYTEECEQVFLSLPIIFLILPIGYLWSCPKDKEYCCFGRMMEEVHPPHCGSSGLKLEDQVTETGSSFCHQLALWPGESHFTSLSLTFPHP